MGRFAQLARINVSGSVRVEFERTELVAGDFLRGVAYVHVLRPVAAEALVVVVSGREKTSWWEQTNNRSYNQRRSNTFFSQQIVLATLPQHYAPGDYVYPFQYQLPATLPGVIAISSSPDGMSRMQTASAEVKYKLEVRLRANGFFVADLSAQYALRVHARPHADDSRAIEGKVSESVRFLALFKKGTCDITALLEQRALAAGTSAVVRPQIHNNTRRRLETVSLRLVQSIELSGAGEHTHTIQTCERPGVDAGEYFTQALDLAVPSSLEPTCTATTLFAVSYTLRVKCSYSGCPGASLDFPLVVLPRIPDFRYLQQQQQQLAYDYVPLAIPLGGC